MDITKLCFVFQYFILEITCTNINFQRSFREPMCSRKHNVLQCPIDTRMPDSGIKTEDYSLLAEKFLENENVLSVLNATKIKREYKRLQLMLIHELEGLQKMRNQSIMSTSFKPNRDVPVVIEDQGYRRIIAGQNTPISSIPWQVSIREKEKPYCGGTIVTRSWILTAAHCGSRKKPKNISIRVGSTWKLKGGMLCEVSRILVHPEYNERTKSHDVALMSTHTPLHFSNNIMPLRIITRNATIPANMGAVVSGYGRLWESGSGAIRLQATYVETVAMKLCKRAGFGNFEIYPATMFCAGSFMPKWPDACQGDSGGPIFAEGALMGVVSWGLGCARGNFPGVYVRLSHPPIYNWIQGHISTEKEVEVNF